MYALCTVMHSKITQWNKNVVSMACSGGLSVNSPTMHCFTFAFHLLVMTENDDDESVKVSDERLTIASIL